MFVLEENGFVSGWLANSGLENIGLVKIDPITLELAQGLDNELILIQDTVYHQMTKLQLDKLAQMTAVLVFNSTSQPLQFVLPNVIGMLEQSSPAALVQNQIEYMENQLKNSLVLKSQLITLNEELIHALGGVETQLLRVKKVYEKNAPKRLNHVKGITIYSKYAAGEDAGGEFFDLFYKGNKIFAMMSTSSSFLVSSSIIEFFNEFKSEEEITPELELSFINNVKVEVHKITHNKSRPVEVQLMTCIIDINSLKVSGHVFGEFQLMSNKNNAKFNTNTQLEGDFENAAFELKFERGERLLLNSPGFQKNWSKGKKSLSMSELLLNKDIKPLDALDEIYFQLKKDSHSGFLPFDASSIIMEIQDNVMVKV